MPNTNFKLIQKFMQLLKLIKKITITKILAIPHVGSFALKAGNCYGERSISNMQPYWALLVCCMVWTWTMAADGIVSRSGASFHSVSSTTAYAARHLLTVGCYVPEPLNIGKVGLKILTFQSKNIIIIQLVQTVVHIVHN